MTYTIAATKTQGKWVGTANGIHVTEWVRTKEEAVALARETVTRNGHSVA
jgi:hypothetical protein